MIAAGATILHADCSGDDCKVGITCFEAVDLRSNHETYHGLEPHSLMGDILRVRICILILIDFRLINCMLTWQPFLNLARIWYAFLRRCRQTRMFPTFRDTSNHSSSERSERFVRFEPNVRSERVRYFSERETNVQALKRLTNLIAVK